MIALVRLRESLALESALLGVSVVLARFAAPRLASTRAARRTIAAVALLVVGAHVAWGALPRPFASYGVDVAMALLPLLGLLCLSLVPAVLLGRALSRVLLAPAVAIEPRGSVPTAKAARADAPAREPRPARRAIVAMATLALPAAGLGVGVTGFFTGAALPRTRRVRMDFPRLPQELAGLRILQLSDLHLGCTRRLDELERFLAGADRPDLLMLTGDVAEDLSLLAPALHMIAALKPRLGAFACLGNHEHFHGAASARRIFERSDMDVLVNDARTVAVGDARLAILGVDDPVWMRGDLRPRLARHLDGALQRAGGEADFRLLMSHRPEGFDPAHARGVDLVLSGHTHGGQIGFHEKSVGERLWPERYLWGPYSRGDSRLYTTAGFGDWYPWRPGCPSEAALVELAHSKRRCVG